MKIKLHHLHCEVEASNIFCLFSLKVLLAFHSSGVGYVEVDAESIQQQGQCFQFCHIKDIFFYIRFVEPKLSSVVINRHDSGKKKIDAAYEYLLTDHKICTDLWGCRHKIQSLLLVLRVRDFTALYSRCRVSDCSDWLMRPDA